MILNYKEIKDFKVGDKIVCRKYVPLEEVNEIISMPQHEAKIFRCEVTYIDDKEVRVNYNDKETTFLINDKHPFYAYSKDCTDQLIFSCELGYLNFLDQSLCDIIDFLNY